MSDKGQTAREYFKSGYNCAQSVFLAFAQDLGFDKETAVKISAGFGGGMGRLREVCGALSGSVMVLSMKYACTDPKNFEEKKKLYSYVQQLAAEFREENGSIVCRELLGISKAEKPVAQPEKRTESYYKKRPCADIVEAAAEITQKFLENNP